ncbi:hypothetical protein JAAARDRAFT_141209, partial [Jaapia argillacea MUCL 33604]
MVIDALKLVGVFAALIEQSVPHIYLSVLSFAAAKSQIANHYRSIYPCRLGLESGQALNWPSIQTIIEGHSNIVSSVAFSPDGKHIALGSWDKTARVWDVKSGELVAGPFEGHSSSVTSVAFSADDKHIASGSWDKTVRV